MPLQLSDGAVANLGIGSNLGAVLDSRGGRLRIGALDSASLAGVAGLQMGDEILAVNRAWVRTPEALRSQLNTSVQNDGRAWVYVNRNGTPQWVNLDLASAARGRLGVHVQDQTGVVTVANVYPGSAAISAGLRSGDEVLSVNGVQVESNAAFVKEIRTAAKGDRELILNIRRNGTEQELRTTLGNTAGAAGAANDEARRTAGFRGVNDAAAGATRGEFSRELIGQIRTNAADLRDLVKKLADDDGHVSKEKLAELRTAIDELLRAVPADTDR